MKNFGCTSIDQFLGDRIVYRNLHPLDPRLSPLSEVRRELGLPQGLVPRKSEPDYARVIVRLLRQARSLDAPGISIERLAFVGDTRLNDGNAFANICRAGDWPGVAFIGADRDEPERVDITDQEGRVLYVANRWRALSDFVRYCDGRGFAFDERTAAIIDLDKTAMGARGRNDHMIDAARVEAVRRTVGNLLGADFDSQGFQHAYDLLNQPEFHPFTSDNQDYLAYVCLVLGAGMFPLESLVTDIREDRLRTFGQFIDWVDGRSEELPATLREIHAAVYGLVQQGDPTPFKAFRYNEYTTTVAAMGCLGEEATVTDLLAGEIVITQEVREVALRWQAAGVLLFGLSDKPDEASVPTADLLAKGFQPIHRVATHAVGSRG